MPLESIKKEVLLKMYRDMVMSRQIDERLIGYSKAGKFPGFFHPGLGQEAGPVGACTHLRPDDIITFTHRSRGYQVTKGVDVKKMLAEIFGKATGYAKGKGGEVRFCVPSMGMYGPPGTIGSNYPIAVGMALAAQYKKTDSVVITFFGDGASNQGTFHESVNMASVWKLPVIFFCENNGYAEFTSQARHQNIKNIADRAQGYGIPGVIVDGMDIIAVYDVAGEAIKRARAGQGPTLIEAKTYRFLGHSLADDGKLYRTQEEVDSWKAKDPVPAYQKRLHTAQVLTQKADEEIQAQVKQELDEAFRFAEDSPMPSLDEVFTDVY